MLPWGRFDSSNCSLQISQNRGWPGKMRMRRPQPGRAQTVRKEAMTALPGLVLLTVGIVLAGVAVARSGSLPKLASIGQRTGPLAGTQAPRISHTLGWSANLLVNPCPRAASTEKTGPGPHWTAQLHAPHVLGGQLHALMVQTSL